MREREPGKQLGMLDEVDLRRERPALVGLDPPPVREAVEQPVDRQPVLVALHER